MAPENSSPGGKYEYRVWGKHDKARNLLDARGTDKTVETIKDCCFLGDDLDWNAKVRDSTLKVKRLVAEERGFEQWTSEWCDVSGHLQGPNPQGFGLLAFWGW